MPKILIYSTYPSVKPSHGGQKVAAAIVDKYRSLGAEVTYVGIYIPSHYRYRGPDDVHIRNRDSLQVVSDGGAELIGDVATGNVCAWDEDIYAALVEKIVRVKPDIIQIEQPYLLPFFERASKEGYISWQKIVYSSHNIEYKMKAEMVAAAKHLSSARRTEIIEQIKGLESRWMQIADIVIAVTETDADDLKKMGAKKVLVARNGINPTVPSASAEKALRAYYNKHGIEKSLLFVGSGHPPNWTGFLDMVTTGVGFIPHGAKIVVAGGILGMVHDHFIGLPGYQRVCFFRRVHTIGVVSEKRLGAAVRLADVIILITTGGGSNLKTAEAIASGKQVVTTKHALRGYEQYVNLPGIHVADDPADFRAKMVEALQLGEPRRTRAQQKQADGVLWAAILDELQEVVL